MKVGEFTLRVLSVLILSCTLLVLGCTQQNDNANEVTQDSTDQVEHTATTGEPKAEAETVVETELKEDSEPEADVKPPPQPVPPTPESSMVE